MCLRLLQLYFAQVKNEVSAVICSVHCSYFAFVLAVSSMFCFVFERYWSYWTTVLVVRGYNGWK